MEDFHPEGFPPAEVCRREVEGSDVFILMLAHRYGSRPPDTDRSHTELEYAAAVRSDKPLHIFAIDPSFPWPPTDVSTDSDAAALACFVAEVKARHVVKSFGELASFREDLFLALAKYSTTEGTGNGRDGRGTEWLCPRPPVFHAVPPYVGSAPFTGRRADLDTLDTWGQSADPVMVVEAIGGAGKSALTWEWSQRRAPLIIDGLAGRLWWSFYDGSASITRFLRELLAYSSGRSLSEVGSLARTDLAQRALAVLRESPFLLILDGFERLLAAYHRFDPSKMLDHEVEATQRSLIEPFADEVIRSLTAVGPSKVLISSRLMPEALEGRFGWRLPGVSHLRLPGLTDTDTIMLLERLSVVGTPGPLSGFFHRLGNHPLMVGIVAGLVRDYRHAPGSFDSWVADPAAGGKLALPDLNLTQRRTHILTAALAGLAPAHRRLLGWISVLAGAVDWRTLEAINPFHPQASGLIKPESDAKDRHTISESQVNRARVALDIALKDLEDRGLLWWDRAANAYDLHPIVRAYTHDQLEDSDRVRANNRVRDHFQALPPEDIKVASSVEDLRQTVTLFRALVGARQEDDAAALWRTNLHDPLLVRIGASATAVELLSPIADYRREGVRMDLAAALFFQGRYEAAIAQDTGVLKAALKTNSSETVARSLLNLAEDLVATGSEIASARCLNFVVDLDRWHGLQAHVDLQRGQAAIRQGKVEDGIALLDSAKKRGAPSQSPWFMGDIWYWREYAALMGGIRSRPNDIDVPGADWGSRRRGAELRCLEAIRSRRWDSALDAAQEAERLDRDAGREATPAITAYLLIELGRLEEAQVALNEVLARLNRLHPMDRPHYWVAQALISLGRFPEAREHAHLAYRQAWRDGPPYCQYWDLKAAKVVVERLCEPLPELPTIAPSTVIIPLEVEVRAYIAAK
jgi:tetratricopeptide (TPR) repeat protein